MTRFKFVISLLSLILLFASKVMASGITYPYTWDFAQGDWTQTQTDVKSTNSGFSPYGTSGTYYMNAATASDTEYPIDMIKGLKFTAAANQVGLDWQYKHMWIAEGVTITVPSVPKDYYVWVVTNGNVSLDTPPNTELVMKDANGNSQVANLFHVTSSEATDVALKSTAPTWITAIKVMKDMPVLSMARPTDLSEVDLTPNFSLASTVTFQNGFSVNAVITNLTDNSSFTISGTTQGKQINFDEDFSTRTLASSTNYAFTVQPFDAPYKENNAVKLDYPTFYFTTKNVTSTSVPSLSSHKETHPTSKSADVVYGGTKGASISATFSEEMSVVPGAIINVIPVNGSEGVIYNGAGNTDTILFTLSGDKKSVTMNYTGDDLKYDLTYQVTIPRTALVSSLGKPMAKDVTYYFKMQKKQDAEELTATQYPYTWDFENITSATYKYFNDKSVKEESSLGAYKGSSYYYWVKYTGSKNGSVDYMMNYNNGKSSSTGMNQGDELKFANGQTTPVVLPEYRYIRMSMPRSGSDKIQLRVDEDKIINLTFNGNTSYFTLPNVPKGAKLYIKAYVKDVLAVNSRNAHFTIGGAATDNTIAVTYKDLKDKVNIYVVEFNDDVKNNSAVEGQDISFIASDVTLYKMAVATDVKSYKAKFDGWATDARAYPVDYSLTNTFYGKDVKAYIVTGSATNVNTKTNYKVAEMTKKPVTAVAKGTGVIMQLAGSTADVTDVPLFSASYYTQNESGQLADVTDNKLVGVYEKDATIGSTEAEGNYIFTNVLYKLKGDDEVDTDVKYPMQMGFYNTVSGTIGKNKAYLHLGTASSAKSYNIILLGDTAVTNGLSHATVMPETQNGAYYTLQGVRLQGVPQTKGIYIHNGKKTIIR